MKSKGTRGIGLQKLCNQMAPDNETRVPDAVCKLEGLVKGLKFHPCVNQSMCAHYAKAKGIKPIKCEEEKKEAKKPLN